MRLTTPDAYVDAYGVTETGRLLANQGTIDPAGDDKASYEAVMYNSGELTTEVTAALNRYIDDAGDEIIPRIRRWLVWPLQSDGFELTASKIPSELGRIAREVARYYLHDEDVRTVEEVSFIERRYRNALQTADRIGSGEYTLTGVDSRYDDTEEEALYTI